MSPSINSLYQKANNQVAANDLENALITYKKICKSQKNDVSAHTNLGNIAGKLGRFEEAEAAFRTASRLQNMNGPASISLAQTLDAQGKYDEAIKILDKYHKNTSNNEALLHIGVLYGKKEDFKNSISYLEQYIKTTTTNSFAYHCLASAYEALDDYDVASDYYKKSLTIPPPSAQIHNNYASMLQKMGDWDNALIHYTQALKLVPLYPIAHHNIATLYLIQGKMLKAKEHFTQALKIDNNYVEAIVGLGKTFALDNHYDDAIKTYEQAIRINGRCAEAYSNMALSYMSKSDYDKAMEAYETALSIEPDNVEIQCNIILLLERKGDFELAIEKITPLVDKDPFHPDIAKAFGELSRKLNKQADAIQNITTAADNKTVGPITKSELYFLAGKLADDIGEYDDAFHYYQSANNLQPYNYDRKRSERSLNLIKKLYTNEQIAKLTNTLPSKHNPIFIIGMPRSGTTLVESIISSHPEVYGAGELHYMNDIAINIVQKCPENLDGVTLGDLLTIDEAKRFAESYIHSSAKLANGARFVTDKMPHNFQHIGLIKMFYPEAKIIHCLRNPIDVCLSIYFNNFNTAHTYATDLDELSEYYRSFYNEILQHWQDTFDDPYLTVNYEDLVSNQEEMTRKIVRYCGLDWADECLQFHKSKRNISTFSYDQVRKPMYTKSVNRWEKYESHLGSIIQTLGNIN